MVEAVGGAGVGGVPVGVVVGDAEAVVVVGVHGGQGADGDACAAGWADEVGDVDEGEGGVAGGGGCGGWCVVAGGEGVEGVVAVAEWVGSGGGGVPGGWGGLVGAGVEFGAVVVLGDDEGGA